MLILQFPQVQFLQGDTGSYFKSYPHLSQEDTYLLHLLVHHCFYFQIESYCLSQEARLLLFAFWIHLKLLDALFLSASFPLKTYWYLCSSKLIFSWYWHFLLKIGAFLQLPLNQYDHHLVQRGDNLYLSFLTEFPWPLQEHSLSFAGNLDQD